MRRRTEKRFGHAAVRTDIEMVHTGVTSHALALKKCYSAIQRVQSYRACNDALVVVSLAKEVLLVDDAGWSHNAPRYPQTPKQTPWGLV